jgi:hypothetical protein
MSLHAAGTTIWNRICTLLCSYRYFYYYRYHYFEVNETSRNKSNFWVRVWSIPAPSLRRATLLFGYQRLHITDSDCRVCIWPWHLVCAGNTDLLLYVTRCIPFTNTLDWSAVAFCAFEITQFFSVVFWVVRAVHTFDFRFLIIETRNKRRPIFVYKTTSCSDRDSWLRLDLCFPPINLASVKGLYSGCAGQMHSLE